MSATSLTPEGEPDRAPVRRGAGRHHAGRLDHLEPRRSAAAGRRQGPRVSLPNAQWSLTAALIAGAIAAPVLGRLGDGRHRRRSILGALLVRTAGGVIAGLAASLPVLIVGRVMQGTGLGLAPIAMAAARDRLSGEHSRPRSARSGPALRASRAGAASIAEQLDLHAAFFFGAILSAAALLAAYLEIPSNEEGPAVSTTSPAPWSAPSRSSP